MQNLREVFSVTIDAKKLQEMEEWQFFIAGMMKNSSLFLQGEITLDGFFEKMNQDFIPMGIDKLVNDIEEELNLWLP